MLFEFWRDQRALHLRCASLHRRHQRVIGKVAVAHSTLMVGVTENAAHGEQVDPGVDHERRRRVPEIVDPQIGQPRRIPRGVPRVFDAGKRLSGFRVGNQPGAPIPAPQCRDDVDRRLRERHVPRLARLRHGNEPRSPFEIDVLPLRVEQFRLAFIPLTHVRSSAIRLA